MSTDDNELMLDAYADGELDASAALALERRLAAEPDMKARFDKLTALRAALRSGVPRDVASDTLRAKITALSAPGLPARMPRVRTFDWRQMAASAAVAAMLASGGTALLLGSGAPGPDISGIVAEHRRALLAANPLDVESTDKHTVKPWFDAKLALSPAVVDLTAEGFPLAGGRVEVVAGKLVPAMIYRRHNHIISLVAVPRTGARDDGAVAANATQDGYTVTSWHGQDFDYAAVSDVAPDELAAFVKAWRTSAK